MEAKARVLLKYPSREQESIAVFSFIIIFKHLFKNLDHPPSVGIPYYQSER
jgi:hypothetical protein